MNTWVGICLLVALAIYVAVVALLPLALIFALNTLFGLNIEISFTTWVAGAVLLALLPTCNYLSFK